MLQNNQPLPADGRPNRLPPPRAANTQSPVRRPAAPGGQPGRAQPPRPIRPVRQTKHTQSLRFHFLIGMAAILIFLGGFFAWAGFSAYAGAVMASGRLVVESHLEQIQHPTGGVVAKVAVTDGDRVKAGDLLIRLDDTVTRANLDIIVGQIDQLAVRAARLRAEQFGKQTLDVPPILSDRLDAPEVKAALAAEQTLLTARNDAAASQKQQLSERIAQTQEEIAGLEAEVAAKTEEASIIKPELESVRKLYAKNLVQVAKVNALQREAVQLDGAIGQLRASVAGAKGRILETQTQMLSVDANRVADAMHELRETDSKLNELVERRVAALDGLRRLEIRAPHNGVVHELKVRTVGGVVASGETLMMIVPDVDGLAIDARIQPEDIDSVRVDQEVVVRLSGLNHSTTPELVGRVMRVGAELATDPETRRPYYAVRVAFNPGETDRLHDVRLVPGMPAEVLVTTTERTFATYMMKPIFDRFSRAFREE